MTTGEITLRQHFDKVQIILCSGEKRVAAYLDSNQASQLGMKLIEIGAALAKLKNKRN